MGLSPRRATRAQPAPAMGPMSQREIEAVVREVTDEEVEFYRVHG